ncbi:hypothetical protein [Pseudomonas sp. zfem002]|uniref:hypothetical protein n=1 Tax=Pseudomonas sp. zfem002 TaxID=3078197 RepID=UPI00292A2E4C|nr:hypothetical protein [Pseudomonas sp. zfem002]MDU9394534.1 hypothetical protein [Pseudomonas sp. zfem002]
MNRIILTLIFLGSATGCSTYQGPGKALDWNDLNPPQSGALGRAIMDGNGVLGEQVVSLTSNSILISDSAVKYETKNYSQLGSSAELQIKAVAANLGYEYQGSNSSLSRELKVASIQTIKDVEEVNKIFVYQCLVAGSYEFVAKSLNTANASLDAAKSQWAKGLGIASANINLSSKPDDHDSITVSVASPNVCLSYKSAEYKEQRGLFGWFGPEVRNIPGPNQASSFTLSNGSYSNRAYPDIKDLHGGNQPALRLKYAVAENAAANLYVCTQLASSSGAEKCLPLRKGDDGLWQGAHSVGRFWTTNNDLFVVYLNLDSRLTEQGIAVINPRLEVSQYKLTIR